MREEGAMIDLKRCKSNTDTLLCANQKSQACFFCQDTEVMLVTRRSPFFLMAVSLCGPVRGNGSLLRTGHRHISYERKQTENNAVCQQDYSAFSPHPFASVNKSQLSNTAVR